MTQPILTSSSMRLAVTESPVVKCIELSTGHLSPSMRRWLDQAAKLLTESKALPAANVATVMEFPEGWVLSVSPSLFSAAGAPARIQALVRAAYAEGVGLIRFDRDADYVPGLPAFDDALTPVERLEVMVTGEDSAESVELLAHQMDGARVLEASNSGLAIGNVASVGVGSLGFGKVEDEALMPAGFAGTPRRYEMSGAFDVAIRMVPTEGQEVGELLLTCGRTVSVTAERVAVDGAVLARWEAGRLCDALGREIESLTVEIN